MVSLHRPPVEQRTAWSSGSALAEPLLPSQRRMDRYVEPSRRHSSVRIAREEYALFASARPLLTAEPVEQTRWLAMSPETHQPTVTVKTEASSLR